MSAGGRGDAAVRVRLLLADEGSFHHETIRVPASLLDRHERLVDLLAEEPELLKQVYVDLDRLCSARVLDADEDEGSGD